MISIEHIKTQFRKYIKTGYDWNNTKTWILNTFRMDNIGNKIFQLWTELYKIIGDCDCSTVGDCQGKIATSKFLIDKGYYVQMFNNKFSKLDGYFLDNNDNQYYMEVKYSNYDISTFGDVICCTAKKLEAFQKYNIKNFYMIMVDKWNIYFKNVPINYYEYPEKYIVRDELVKETTELDKNDKEVYELKLVIPLNEFNKYKLNAA